MKINEYFDIREFVPPQIWNRFGEKSIWFIDPKIIEIAKAYREFFEVPIIINNWYIGGRFMYRGYRPPRANVGTEYSQHKSGRAFDCHSPSITPQHMYKLILDNQEFFMEKGLTTVENVLFTPTWIHSDCRPTNKKELLIVNPL